MVYDKSLNCLLDRGKMWRRRRETGGSQCQVCDLSLRRCRVLVVCYFTNTLEWVKSGCQWYVFAKEDWARSSRLLSSCLSIIYIEYLIFSYYVLHYRNICIYILYNLYINTHNNVTFSYKRNYTDIGLPCNRSVKLPEEASKPSPVRTRIRPIKIMSIKKCIVRNIYNSLSPLKLRKGEKGEHASESRQKFNG